MSNDQVDKPIRVLCLDGGGMRGIYQASYLRCFSEHVSRSQGRDLNSCIDIGKAFDLIVGTSTGGIIACALMAGIPLMKVENIYRKEGKNIFPLQKIRAIPFLGEILQASGLTNRKGADALKKALLNVFNEVSLGDTYKERKIALAIPAVDVSRHAAFVFKTPHLTRLDGRDDDKKIVDICLATSAAPILRSMAIVNDSGVNRVFADGGLWANNPGAVGMIEAFEIVKSKKSNSPIQLFMLGTLPAQGGTDIKLNKLNKGFFGWKWGVRPMLMSMDSQAFGYDYISGKIGELHCPNSFAYRMFAQCPPKSIMSYLSRMDDARDRALDALSRQAISDADFAWGKACSEKPVAQLVALKEALESAPNLIN